MKQKLKITREQILEAYKKEQIIDSMTCYEDIFVETKYENDGKEHIWFARLPDSIEIEVDVPEQRIYGRSESENLIPLQMIADVKTSIEIDFGSRITELEKRMEKLEELKFAWELINLSKRQ